VVKTNNDRDPVRTILKECQNIHHTWFIHTFPPQTHPLLDICPASSRCCYINCSSWINLVLLDIIFTNISPIFIKSALLLNIICMSFGIAEF
jgi:hypothetical protein